MLLQINSGAKGRSKTASTSVLQQRIHTLNERYINNEIDLREFLDGLSLSVATQNKFYYFYVIFFLSLQYHFMSAS